jgi:hypothetical protein
MQSRVLLGIIVLHTVIWAFFAACILALPVAATLRRFDWAAILTGLTLIELCALAFNGGRCPLTDIAAKFSQSQELGFDIYLPHWLARHNKAIFGTLFVLGECLVLWKWLR